LHGVELCRRPVHAAQPRHRLEDFQIACVHAIFSSEIQIAYITFNRFKKIRDGLISGSGALTNAATRVGLCLAEKMKTHSANPS
jgi:hypothetical protein